MLRGAGYISAVVMLIIVSFFALSLMVHGNYLGLAGPMEGAMAAGVSGKAGTDDIPDPVFTCPENECPTEDEMSGCKEAIMLYEEKISRLEEKESYLRERIGNFLLEGCEEAGGAYSAEKPEEAVSPESVRDFAVFLVSGSGTDPATSVYRYVRKNVAFVSDPGDDYVASACETLLSGGGDCEDHAVLLASLLESVGVDARVISIPGEHTFAGIVLDTGRTEGMCDKFLYFDHDGDEIVVADTTFSECMGRISDRYVEYEGDEWDWKTKPVVIDV